MSPEERKNAKYYGHLGFCLQPKGSTSALLRPKIVNANNYIGLTDLLERFMLMTRALIRL
jgi:hypothetical protein